MAGFSVKDVSMPADGSAVYADTTETAFFSAPTLEAIVAFVRRNEVAIKATHAAKKRLWVLVDLNGAGEFKAAKISDGKDLSVLQEAVFNKTLTSYKTATQLPVFAIHEDGRCHASVMGQPWLEQSRWTDKEFPDVTAKAEQKFVCSVCHVITAVKMDKCSRCRQQFYCGKACQKAHWPEHKKTCVAKCKGDV